MRGTRAARVFVRRGPRRPPTPGRAPPPGPCHRVVVVVDVGRTNDVVSVTRDAAGDRRGCAVVFIFFFTHVECRPADPRDAAAAAGRHVATMVREAENRTSADDQIRRIGSHDDDARNERATRSKQPCELPRRGAATTTGGGRRRRAVVRSAAAPAPPPPPVVVPRTAAHEPRVTV